MLLLGMTRPSVLRTVTGILTNKTHAQQASTHFIAYSSVTVYFVDENSQSEIPSI